MAEPSKAPPLASILPHLPHLEATPASELPPEPPPPIPHSGDADEEIPLFALGVPPDFTALVEAIASQRLGAKEATPLLLQRANLLMQDAVEAACMCARACVEPTMLVKHVLGAEHYAQYLEQRKAEAEAGADGRPPLDLDEPWTVAVIEHVGEVRCARSPPSPPPRAPPPCPLRAAAARRVVPRRRRTRRR